MSAVPPLIPGSLELKTLDSQTAKIENMLGSAVSANSWKSSVRAASIGANLTLFGIQTVDTVVLVAGDTILVKDQTNPIQNGIYYVSSTAWSRYKTMLAGSNASGAMVYVNEGSSTNEEKIFVCTNLNTAATVGTNSLTFVTFVSTVGAAGSTTQVQYNLGGELAGSTGLTFVAGGKLTSANGFTATAGGVLVTAGGLTVTAGGVTVTAGGITASTGNIAASAGSVSASTTVSAGTTVTGGTGVIATTGNVTATAGDVVVTLATRGVTLTKGTFATAGPLAGGTTAAVTSRQGFITIADCALATNTAASIVVTATSLSAVGSFILVSITARNALDGAPVAYVSEIIADAFTITIMNANDLVAMSGTMSVGYMIV